LLFLCQDTEYGRSFGNLVTLGTMHLAPAGPAVDAFVAYATASTATFGRSTANNGTAFFNYRVSEFCDWGAREPIGAVCFFVELVAFGSACAP
jgi:hypothetical protein